MTPERKVPVYPNSTIQRFWSKVKIGIPDDCWNYQNSSTPGYGSFYVRVSETKEKTTWESWRAHRFAYTILRGPIPDGLFVLHSCDNPACVNPDHLWIGTHQDNMDDAINKGRLNTWRQPPKTLVPRRYLKEPFIVR